MINNTQGHRPKRSAARLLAASVLFVAVSHALALPQQATGSKVSGQIIAANGQCPNMTLTLASGA